MKKRIVFLLTALFVFAFSSLASANVEMGMTGSVVQSVQYMLIDTGYLSDGADGVFGSGTQSAVRRFQADHGLDADGVVGTQTMQALADASGREVPEESGSYQYSMVMDATAYTADDPGNSGITAGMVSFRSIPMLFRWERGCILKDTGTLLPMIRAEPLLATALIWEWTTAMKL